MVERSALPPGSRHVTPELVTAFVTEALVAAGVPEPAAERTADVLVSADLRGIRSHGLARLPYFLSRLDSGAINVRPKLAWSRGTSTTARLDADDALGTVAADEGMREAIAMAHEHGTGLVTVRRSSHFGYAGYWADMARRAGMIGIAMSNGGGHTAPTFAVEGVLGTNPLSVTVPGGVGGTDFYLDMATSTVALGKIETALREGRAVPTGWIPADSGPPELDDRGKLAPGFPVLPLGGEGDELGGHKGYGLSLLVELLCGSLSGSPLPGRLTVPGQTRAPSVGHFLGAIRVDGFRDAAEVGADMEATFEVMRAARRAPGQDRIYIPGEPESEAEQAIRETGIPVTPALRTQLADWAGTVGLTAEWLTD